MRSVSTAFPGDLRSKRDTAAAALFTSAKSADDYRKVIAEYPGTMPGGNACLLLAGQAAVRRRQNR